MNAYTEPTYDVDHCNCGAKLPEESRENTWDFHGFCNIGCAVRSPGGFLLTGDPARDMAEHPGKHGGPGFERELVRDWLKAATPNAPAILQRISGDADLGPQYASSWSWRLHAGGDCLFQRLTPKNG